MVNSNFLIIKKTPKEYFMPNAYLYRTLKGRRIKDREGITFIKVEEYVKYFELANHCVEEICNCPPWNYCDCCNNENISVMHIKYKAKRLVGISEHLRDENYIRENDNEEEYRYAEDIHILTDFMEKFELVSETIGKYEADNEHYQLIFEEERGHLHDLFGKELDLETEKFNL